MTWDWHHYHLFVGFWLIVQWLFSVLSCHSALSFMSVDSLPSIVVSRLCDYVPHPFLYSPESDLAHLYKTSWTRIAPLETEKNCQIRWKLYRETLKKKNHAQSCGPAERWLQTQTECYGEVTPATFALRSSYQPSYIHANRAVTSLFSESPCISLWRLGYAYGCYKWA